MPSITTSREAARGGCVRRRASATVLGRVKRWLLAMLACKRKLRVAPAPLRAFDSACAPWRFESVGTKGVPVNHPAALRSASWAAKSWDLPDTRA